MITYLIEDSPLKEASIRDFVVSHFPTIDVRVFGSFQSGLRAVEALVPDLILLDMTLPTFDRILGSREGRTRPLGGYDLMRKLKLREVFPKFIVITQLDMFGEREEKVTFEEISERCRRDFSANFLGSVYFRQSVAAWKKDLADLIGPLIESNNK